MIATARTAPAVELCRVLFIRKRTTLRLLPTDHPSWTAWRLGEPHPQHRYIYLMASHEVFTVCFELSHIAGHQRDMAEAAQRTREAAERAEAIVQQAERIAAECS